MMETVTRTTPGDCALACRHVDPRDLGADLHLLKMEEGTKIVATPESAEPDAAGTEFEARWLFLCDDCYRLGMNCATIGGDLLQAASQDFVVDRVIEATQRRTDG